MLQKIKIKQYFFAFALSICLLITYSCVVKLDGVYAASININNVEIKSLDLYDGVLPTEYKNADIGAINNQGKHGDCWAFGALNTLQINIYKMGFRNPDSLDGFYDFSDSAVVKYAMTTRCSVCGSIDTTIDYENGTCHCNECGGDAFGINYDNYNSFNYAGGYSFSTVNYLVSNPILVSESQWPHNVLYPSYPEPDSYEQYNFKINSVYKSKDSSLNELKRMVVSFGGVYSSHIFYDTNVVTAQYTDSDSNTYYTFCGQNMNVAGGHAICVIGYDDNFSKDNFIVNKANLVAYLQQQSQYGACREFNNVLKQLGLPYSDDIEVMNQADYIPNAIASLSNMSDEIFKQKYAPKTDGAILIKNSWGVNDDCSTGCYWLPYDQLDDMSLLSNGFYAFDSVSETKISEIEYAHDESGAFGFVDASELDEDNSKDYVGYANIFDFEKVSKIDYISYEALSRIDYPYNIYYAPVVNNTIIDSKKVLLKNGTASANKYFNTIYLDEEFIIPDKKGAILFEIPKTYDVSFGFDCNVSINQNENTYYLAIAKENQSQILKKDNYEPAVLEEEVIANVCLRVGITQSIKTPITFNADYSKYLIQKEAPQMLSLQENNYTAESWEQFINAKTEFLEIAMDLDIWQQETIDNSITNLKSKILTLEYKPANYTVYNEMKSSSTINTLQQSNYTETSWNTFIDTKNIFDSIPQDLNITEQSQIDNVITSLQTALTNLILKPADFIEYNALKLYATTNTLSEDIYTVETWSTYTTAKTIFDAILPTATILEQNEINTATNNYQNAISNLIQKPADYTRYLEMRNSNAINNLKESNYTEDSWNAFVDIKILFISLPQDLKITEQEQIDTKLTNLQTALNNLVLKKADFDEYNALKLYAIANAPSEDDYTTETWTAYTTAKTTFEAISQTTTILNQNEVNQATINYKNAISSLIQKPADYTIYEQTKSTYNAKVLISEQYTTDSWAEYQIALTNFNNINKNLTKQEQTIINQSIENLNLSFANLEKVNPLNTLTLESYLLIASLVLIILLFTTMLIFQIKQSKKLARLKI